MKKQMKRMITLVLAVVLAISMCACESNENDNSGESAATTKKAGTEKLSEKKPNSAIDCFSGEINGIWYYIEPDNGYVIGKDMKVEKAYVFEDGKCNRYRVDGDYTLGDLSKMTDEEIVEMLEAEAASQATTDSAMEEIKAEKAACEELLASGYLDDFSITYDYNWSVPYYTFTTENMAVVKEALENYKNELDEVLNNGVDTTQAECSLAIYTDSTGNNTAYETVTFNYPRTYSVDIAQRMLSSLSQLNEKEYAMDGAMMFDGLKDYINYNIETNVNDTEILGFLTERGYTEEELGIMLEEVLWALAEGMYAEEDLNVMLEKTGGMLTENYIVEDCNIGLSNETSVDSISLVNGMGGDGDFDNAQVYDSYYSGFLCEGYNYLLTRSGARTAFELDAVGTEGIAVDPE